MNCTTVNAVILANNLVFEIFKSFCIITSHHKLVAEFREQGLDCLSLFFEPIKLRFIILLIDSFGVSNSMFG